VRTTTRTSEATVIQTRHRIPETKLTEDQVLVYQVPIPEPLRFLEPRETETRQMHAHADYGLMHVKLYEDIARYGHISTSYAYPVKVDGRYVMDPSPTPKFDNPKLDDCPALQLFGAGREKRIYAIPPYTKVVSLDFEDHPFEASRTQATCELCGAEDSFLDEVITDDRGGRMFVCSDTDYCRATGGGGRMTPLLDVRGLTKRYGGARAAPMSPSRSIPARSWGSWARADRESPRFSIAWRASSGRQRRGDLRHPRRRAAGHADDVRARTAHARPDRLGLRPPEPARRTSDGRERRG
jgi:hypothetical protein